MPEAANEKLHAKKLNIDPGWIRQQREFEA